MSAQHTPQEGDRVTCFAGCIDRGIGNGETGTLTGFARLSAYHPREAMVRFDDGRSGWFWVRDLTAARTMAEALA